MRSRFLRWFAVGAMLAVPVSAYAQVEATVLGTVTDTTGGALPGVTVTAVHEASGNIFEAVTDAEGRYRIPARIGSYALTATLVGFGAVEQTVTLQVGQEAVLDFQMGVGGVQETVTVTGEAPLLDLTESSMGGNIDPRQMAELPLQGRNWMELALLAPGARVNAITNAPSDYGATGASSSRVGGDFQTNVDGQEITQLTSGSSSDGQPKFSREAVAEFEFLSSRFDATQGRSMGLQVNVVTKSGTNTPSGSFLGFFRDDKYIAKDFVAGRVLPFSNKQLTWTFGGPIRQDRIHVFGYYEYESEPRTLAFDTPYPEYNQDFSGVLSDKKAGVKLDAQFTPRNRLTGRYTMWRARDPFQATGSTTGSTPRGIGGNDFEQDQIMSTLTSVLSNRVVNELKVGYADLNFGENNEPDRLFGPQYVLEDITIGAPGREQIQGQKVIMFRDDLTYSFTGHTIKAGAEYLYRNVTDIRCRRCDGVLDADEDSVASLGFTVPQLFPDLFNPSGWNVDALAPITSRWRQAAYTTNASEIPRYSSGLWVQDDWSVTDRLTLNLGVRYDVEINAYANDVQFLPHVPGDQPNDTNNIAPRLGFTYSAAERTVVRGGFGRYYGTVTNAHFAKFYEQAFPLEIQNDGRSDFPSNPFNGPTPTFAEVKASLCTVEDPFKEGCFRREMPTGGIVFGPEFTMPYAWQSSIGVQQQVGDSMALEADYVFIATRDQPRGMPVNITYDPATGRNIDFDITASRPIPSWGYISLEFNGARANLHQWQTAFTKRFSDNWQASGTYTLSWFKDAGPKPQQFVQDGNGGSFEPLGFETAPDLGGEYTVAVGDQRHRAVVNGIWEIGYGFQLSGLYFYGSGQHQDVRYGTDVGGLGDRRPNEQRLRPDGTIVARNSFVSGAHHRADLRLQRRFPLVGRATIDGILEVFNLFNHANYARYETREVNRRFGDPRSPRQSNVAFSPRGLQVGFRFSF